MRGRIGDFEYLISRQTLLGVGLFDVDWRRRSFDIDGFGCVADMVERQHDLARTILDVDRPVAQREKIDARDADQIRSGCWQLEMEGSGRIRNCFEFFVTATD